MDRRGGYRWRITATSGAVILCGYLLRNATPNRNGSNRFLKVRRVAKTEACHRLSPAVTVQISATTIVGIHLSVAGNRRFAAPRRVHEEMKHGDFSTMNSEMTLRPMIGTRTSWNLERVGPPWIRDNAIRTLSAPYCFDIKVKSGFVAFRCRTKETENLPKVDGKSFKFRRWRVEARLTPFRFVTTTYSDFHIIETCYLHSVRLWTVLKEREKLINKHSINEIGMKHGSGAWKMISSITDVGVNHCQVCLIEWEVDELTWSRQR